jgi:tRNA/tmRNA/rRNA uracil-C5-methylase (TrmA/RlmC/RlmD family)
LHNAKINNVRNITFYNNDAFKVLESLHETPNTIIVDPARDGLGRLVCEKLIHFNPEIIIYLSCNSGTQASDFNNLKNKYEIIYAKPYDMFPQTYHVENLIVLKRK